MIEKGRGLFNRACSFCHGADGRKGLHGPGLRGRDDLTADHVYTTIMHGRPRTLMVSFKDQLSQEEIWQAVAFIMSIQAPSEGPPQQAAASEAARKEALQERTLYLCASPHNLPYSHQDPAMPGFELEIGNAVAKILGLQLIVQYNGAFRNRELYNCDIFMGIVQLEKKGGGPRFFRTKPYYGTGYVLVLPKVAGSSRSQNIGIEAGSLSHQVASRKGIPATLYVGQAEILEGIINREVQGGLVAEAEVGWYLKQHPDAPLHVLEESASDPRLRWNVVMDVSITNKHLQGLLNAAIDQLTDDQTIPSILAKYGVPYHAPFRIRRAILE
ncbi:MAG: c-type cytochrome [Candidatus Methylomirabilales bacterium]